MENSIYHDSLGFHVVTVHVSMYQDNGFTKYNFYLHPTDGWMCIVETSIPKRLFHVDHIAVRSL